MYTVQVDFKLAGKEERSDQLELIVLLLGCWRMNGQVVGRQFPVARKADCYSVFVQTPEKNSLSSRFGNKHVHDCLQKIEYEFSLPEICVLGVDPEGADACNCKSASSYMLFTTYLASGSPLRCGDCFGEVPLYKIPRTYDDEYYNVICWMSDYQSCDSLQMNCAVGERFATNQLSRLDSQLTQTGLEVCRSIQQVTGKKTYYYLYRGSGRSLDSELSRKCPGCNGEWHQQEPVHSVFDFMCVRCGLLSNIAWNCR